MSWVFEICLFMCFNFHDPFQCCIAVSPCGGHDGANRVVSPSPPGGALGKGEDLHFVGFPDALTVPPSGVFVALVLVVFTATFTIALIVRRDSRRDRRSLLEQVRIRCGRGRRAAGPVSAVGITRIISSPAARSLLFPLWGPRILVVGRLALSVVGRLALSALSLLLHKRSSWLFHNSQRKNCAKKGRRRDTRSP